VSDYAVICRTCGRNVYEGNTSPEDGQVYLTAYADSVAGSACPSGRADCPHKSAAITKAKDQTTAALLARVEKLEAKAKP
jgi:hypothetical protein